MSGTDVPTGNTLTITDFTAWKKFKAKVLKMLI
jgi:hypothetical protein